MTFAQMNIVCYMMNHIDGVMVGVIDCGYEPRSGQTKDYEIDICCFFAKHTALWRKSKDWLARNQYNVSEVIVRFVDNDGIVDHHCFFS